MPPGPGPRTSLLHRMCTTLCEIHTAASKDHPLVPGTVAVCGQMVLGASEPPLGGITCFYEPFELILSSQLEDFVQNIVLSRSLVIPNTSAYFP